MTVSILLACYNGDKFIVEQIKSVLAQTFKDFILYISDDGSSDDTLKIITEYAEKDSRIKILSKHEANKSACRHFFYMLEKIQSDVYLFCDQDDVWLPNHISSLVEKYDSLDEKGKTKPVLIHGDLKVVDENLNVISESCIKYMNLPFEPNQKHFYFLQNNVTGCVTLINDELKKYVLKNTPLLYKNINRIPMHDMFFATIASEFGKLYCIHESLELYRQHISNVVGARNGKNPILYIKKIFNISEYKNQLEKYKDYADFFASYFDTELSVNEKKILEKFSLIRKHNKFERIRFILKHGFYKHGFIRNIQLILSI